MRKNFVSAVAGVALASLLSSSCLSVSQEKAENQKDYSVRIQSAASKSVGEQVNTLENLVGSSAENYVPTEEELRKYKDFSSRLSTVYGLSKHGSKIMLYAEMPIYFRGTALETKMAVLIDLRNVDGINELAEQEMGTRTPILSDLIPGAVKQGEAPAQVYLTKEAAKEIRESSYLKSRIYRSLHPSLSAVVVPEGSSQEKYLERNPGADIGLHNFFPEKPIDRYKIDGNKIVKK